MANYIDDEKFYDEMVKYKNAVRESEKQGMPKPQVSNYIGECFLKIAERRSYEHNFSGYTFREEMVEDAVEKCLKYIDNFDEVTYRKPFAYFSQIVWFAFVGKINEEEKEQYVKLKSIRNHEMFSEISNDTSQWDDTGFGETVPMTDYTSDKIDAYIERFEKKMEDKREKNRQKSKENGTSGRKRNALRGKTPADRAKGDDVS